ncbi:interleukin 12Ba precursor [Eucyclogobius newberryi]|uniref:interleukin 12Ba precursor n=1 Tax=Eucyclogobius newberryi TaxID=166745 RepID=UPI003B5B802C
MHFFPNVGLCALYQVRVLDHSPESAADELLLPVQFFGQKSNVAIRVPPDGMIIKPQTSNALLLFLTDIKFGNFPHNTMKLFYLILWSFLHIISPNPINYWTLKHNVLVLEVTGEKGHHPLRCFHSAEDVLRRGDDGGIVWKKDGVTEPSNGNRHFLDLWADYGGGNYSCHNKDGSLLNHTKVLIHEDETKKKKIITGSVKCFAPNYNGIFHCSWTWHSHRPGKVALIKVWRGPYNKHDLRCTEDSAAPLQWTCRSRRSNISCSVDPSGRGISCTDHQHCPYAEEVQIIQITAYVDNGFLLENYSEHFYLSEIVKPDKVQISKVNRTAIEWLYPRSWDSPNSYFPLTFQMGQLKRIISCAYVKSHKVRQLICFETVTFLLQIMTVNCTDNCSSKIKRNTRTVCFRAKDALSNSEWSEWSSERIKPMKQNRRIRRI